MAIKADIIWDGARPPPPLLQRVAVRPYMVSGRGRYVVSAQRGRGGGEVIYDPQGRGYYVAK